MLTLERFKFLKDATIGRLFINDTFFCYTLEDAVRGWGIKVPQYTAIPVHKHPYNVRITYSNRFKREMPLIYNKEPDLLWAGGITFQGVRFHGGNDSEDTDGCILVGRNWKDDKIWDNMETQLIYSINGIDQLIIKHRFV